MKNIKAGEERREGAQKIKIVIGEEGGRLLGEERPLADNIYSLQGIYKPLVAGKLNSRAGARFPAI